MKIITLIPFKNEFAVLPSAISSVKSFSDEIIVINDNSTDNSEAIARSLGAQVYHNKDLINYGWSELSIRRKLLKIGREHGGTHFVCIDADEAVTANFKKNIEILSTLKPGQKLLMQWLAMWKSVDSFRDDQSIWSNNFKDFIFCDDGKMDFPDVWMHTPRTPGDNNNSIRIPLETGAIFHFQFSNWKAFQIKQSWYRCSELIKNNGHSYADINAKYSITLNDDCNGIKHVDSFMTEGIVPPNIDKMYEQNIWRLNQIKEWFNQYGLNFFNNLNIWHVEEIKKLKNEK